MLAHRDAAQAGQNGNILLTVHLEGHWRRVEADADIDLPQLFQRGVIVGDERPIRVGRENHAAGSGKGAAIVRVRHVHLALDLAGERVEGREISLVPVSGPVIGAAFPVACLVAQFWLLGDIYTGRQGREVQQLGLRAVGSRPIVVAA